MRKMGGKPIMRRNIPVPHPAKIKPISETSFDDVYSAISENENEGFLFSEFAAGFEQESAGAIVTWRSRFVMGLIPIVTFNSTRPLIIEFLPLHFTLTVK